MKLLRALAARLANWVRIGGEDFVSDLYDVWGYDDAPTAWDDSIPPGGFVCAVPVYGLPGQICGMPVESEPCPEHNPYDHERDGL